ncbi:right-handed parallel beta-helix repeat-containing protein [Plantactinospora soyae]|uniref:Parallel beta-helix repeat protein n=1 Tax=Plantactinospora soyae TaxID=1544732 RepID=A0A927M5C7_9ACTN|nr:right-handed parallel beta-helix repeat-containing protein [Plantactinospora soyae]MBE1488317.1 parallel beta-helix repeat protein [Plantactinospora soyae]
MRRTSLVAAGTVCVALAGVLPALPATAAPVEQLTVYVNPAVATGAGALERGTGRTLDTAVASIEEAQDVLRTRNVRNATVLLSAGTYRPASTIRVTWAPPGGRLTLGTVGAAAVTIDCGTFEDTSTNTEYGMTVTADNVTVSNYVFQNCRNGGIRAAGTSANRLAGLDVTGNTFRRLGGKFQSGPGNGYGAVHATYTTGLNVEDNLFQNLENTESPAAMHGVYVANYANDTVIYNNRFELISGDPVRSRNRSDNTTVESNKFWRTGAYAIFSDWRFDSEGCSTNGLFDRNQVGTTSYNNDRWNEDAQGSINPVRVRLWGHDAATNANLYGCSSDPITFGGNNDYVTSKPW